MSSKHMIAKIYPDKLGGIIVHVEAFAEDLPQIHTALEILGASVRFEGSDRHSGHDEEMNKDGSGLPYEILERGKL